MIQTTEGVNCIVNCNVNCNVNCIVNYKCYVICDVNFNVNCCDMSISKIPYLRDKAERDWFRGATGVTEGDRYPRFVKAC